jgi:large subunit ribosomal protein L4
MSQISLKTRAGDDAGTVDLDDAIFGIEPNVPVMHQVVTAQLAARRSGTQSTKTRAEVRGGGAKPWKQKGTGRARQGSIRAPQWKGGGVALGPKPRSYAQRTPKKMIRLALRSALSDRAAEGKVIVVDSWNFDAPRTKDAIEALTAIGAEGRVLLVLNGDDAVTWKSFRNLTEVHIIEAGQLNAYDVLVSDCVVFSRDTLPAGTGDDAKAKAKRATPAEPVAPKPANAAVAPKPAKAAVAPKPAAPKPAPAPTDTDAPSSDAAPVEADDMASDLPNRPPADQSKKHAPIKDTDRVKSAADKPDPRFEAARQKAAKEDALRAKAESAKAESEAQADAEAEAAPKAEDEAPKPKGSFSFSNTDEDQQ